MKLFNLEIITPQETLYKGKAVSLVVPAELGYLGVLADHAPLVANLKQGKITVAAETADKIIFYVQNNGFLQILKNNVTLVLD